jgi:selenocysteine-specific elongation factor
LHAHNQVSDMGQAGQRLALNVSGIEKSDARRGDWLVDEAIHAPTTRIDARMRVLASEPKSLAHWTPVHLHVGAEDVGARVVMLEGRSIEPGNSARVRLELDRPIGALHGDRFIVRDQSALRTLGGGNVLDIFAPDSRRRKAQRLAALTALEHPAPEDRLKALLEVEVANGVDASRLGTLWNLSAAGLARVVERVPHRVLGTDAAARLFAPGGIERYSQAVNTKLADHHAQHPDSPGLTQEQLARGVTNKPALKVFEALLKDLVMSRSLARTGAHWHLPSHAASLQGAEKQLWERIKPWLDEAGTQAPKLSELLLRDRNLRKDQVLRVLQRLARMGQVHAVGDEYFIQTQHVLKLALVAKELADRDPNRRLNVKALRDATGMSRHLSVPLVEFFDKIGYTHRDEVGRHIRRDPHRMFGMLGESP